MITKLGTFITVAITALFLAVPSVLHADTASDKKKIQSLTKQLKALPNQGGPNAKVAQLVTKLVNLDPAKANTYYKLGTTKLAQPGAVGAAIAIAKKVNSIVNKSDLSANKKKSVTKTVNKTEAIYTNNPPPTPPYQAMLTSDFSTALA